LQLGEWDPCLGLIRDIDVGVDLTMPYAHNLRVFVNKQMVHQPRVKQSFFQLPTPLQNLEPFKTLNERLILMERMPQSEALWHA
jgi:hypothetical protein